MYPAVTELKRLHLGKDCRSKDLANKLIGLMLNSLLDLDPA